MCNRFNIKTNLRSIATELDAQPAFDFEIAEEIFPLSLAPTLVVNRDGQRELRPMTFGLTPPGRVRDTKMPPFNNARIESREKWPWKKSFERFRCIVPMESFREACYWGQSAGKEVNFSRADGRLLLAAGIFSVTSAPDREPTLSMSLMMRPALDQVMQHGHHRSPIFLDAEGIDPWIDRGPRPPDQSVEVLKQFAIEPNLQTMVAREMVASWTKRKSGNERKETSNYLTSPTRDRSAASNEKARPIHGTTFALRLVQLDRPIRENDTQALMKSAIK